MTKFLAAVLLLSTITATHTQASTGQTVYTQIKPVGGYGPVKTIHIAQKTVSNGSGTGVVPPAKVEQKK